MNQQEVIDLMASSQNETDWNINASAVKAACEGYPPFWFKEIVISGLMARNSAKWKGDHKTHINVG